MPQEEFPQLQVSKGIMQGQISWRKEFIHPTQMLCLYCPKLWYINKSESWLRMLGESFNLQNNCCIRVAIPYSYVHK